VAILWSTASRGAQVIPCVLIAGLPIILVPEGVTLTGWSAGALDAAWWPGSSFAGFSAYIKPWLSLEEPLSWSERAQPIQPEMLDVSSVTVRVSDIGLRPDGTGGAATDLFAAQATLAGTWITADVSASATTVSVASTAGFSASGDLFVGRETMTYTSTTATSFAVGTAANRGKYGSPVQHHWYTGNGNAAIANPEVTDGPPEIIGRTATVWLLRVSSAGVVTEGSLAFYGTIGAGVVISEDAEAWTFRIDHIVKRLATPLRGETIAVGGYVHGAPEDVRGNTPNCRIVRAYCPTFDWWVSSSVVTQSVDTLTIASASPDNGGYHATAEGYVNDLSTACQALTPSTSYMLVGDRLRVYGTSATAYLRVWWMWDTPGEDGIAVTESISTLYDYTSRKPFPGAWVPVFQGSRVYLSASDYALVPAVPSSASATVYYVLAFDKDDETRYAKITAKTSSSGIYYLTCDAITVDRAQLDAFGTVGVGFIVTEPSAARLGCYVQATDWVTALEALVESFDTSIGETLSDAFDFTDMRAVASRYVGPFAGSREYVADLATSVLDLVTNECRLNGYTLVMHNGRISIARLADFAPTEVTSGSISTADLVADSPRPQYSRGFDSIVNAVRFESPQTRITVNVVDATSLARYGPGRTTLTATTPAQITGTVVNLAGDYARLAAQAATMLGPLRYPYEYVTVTTPLHKAEMQTGALVSLSLWRVPDQSGARGISSRVGQIIGREHAYYDAGDGRVTYTLRLSPTNIQGWAPTVLVASGGISGADVTADTSTFGAAGFAPSGSTGGAEFFVTGDKVRLVEIDNASPAASAAFTVQSVAGSVVTLTSSPGAGWVSIASGALKALLIADDWGTATAAQEEYAYLSDTSYRLDVNTRSRIYAS